MTSTRTLGQLPTEIVRAICEQLSEVDISTVRLSSRFLCDVSTPFLLEGIHLILTESSFQCLTDISTHPIISREIKTLFYEPDRFRPYRTQEHWEKHILDEGCPLWCESMDECSMYYSTIPDSYLSDNISENTQQLLKDHLADGWAAYQSTYEGQERLRSRGYGSDQICSAISKFPNLTSICMSLGSNTSCQTDQIGSARFKKCRKGQHYYDELDSFGVQQMRSLLLGASFANLSLLQARLGDVNWRIFQATNVDFESMKKPLKSVFYLELRIIVGNDTWESDENSKCYEYLESSKRLLHMIEDSLMIETLVLTFDSSYPHCPTDLKYVVGSIRWTFLATVWLQCLDTDEDTWVDFYSNHRQTLRHVHFDTIRLTSGRWVSTLQAMRNILSLTSATLGGSLLGNNPPQHWTLDLKGQIELDDINHQCNRTRVAIEEYLISGGDCPLLKEDDHPQQSW